MGSDLPAAPGDREIYVRADFLNLAGFSPLDEAYLSTLREFCNHFRAKRVHATYAAFEHSGIYFFNPVAAILSPNLLNIAIDRIQMIKTHLGLPIAIKNYFDPQTNVPAFMPATDFYYELTSRSGAEFICDVKSTVCFAKAFGDDVTKCLKRMLEIDKASAFIQSSEDLQLIKDLKFKGPVMSYEDSPEVTVVCQGEFDDPA